MSTTVQFEGHPLTIHGWEDWVPPGPPVTGPPMTWDDNDTEAAHYTAATNLIDGDIGEFVGGIPQFLRNVHLDYLLHRPSYDPWGNLTSTGYSIGYNWAIDWLGGIWKLRGWDIKCAANIDWNEQTWAVLCLVDGQDPLTDAGLRSARYLHREGERRANKMCLIHPHSRLGSNPQRLLPWPGNQTGCCGNGIRGQMIVPSGLQGGKLNHLYVLPEPPEDIDMSSDYKALVRVKDDAKRVTALVLISSDGVQMFGIPQQDVAKVAAKVEVSTTPDDISVQLYDDFQMRALRSAGFRPTVESNFTAANGKLWTGLPG